MYTQAQQHADDLATVDARVVNVNGFSVVPEQSQLNMNQPLFYEIATSRWCTYAGVTQRGLNVRYLDGTYGYGIDPSAIANIGIQA